MDLGETHGSNLDFICLRQEKAGCPMLEHKRHLMEPDNLEGQRLELEEG